MVKSDHMGSPKVYLVVYGNYWPWEVESVWSSKEAAQGRADELPGDWVVAEFSLDHPGNVQQQEVVDD